MTTSAELLQRVPLLAPLSDGDRDSLAAALSRHRYRRGDIIFQKDDPGHALYIVERGSVRIYVPSSPGSDLILAVMGAGDFFGDLSLLEGRPRSASAAATTETLLPAAARGDGSAL